MNFDFNVNNYKKEELEEILGLTSSYDSSTIELNANNILYINADAKNEISFNKYFETNKIVNKINTLFTNYLLCHSLNNYSGQPLQHNIIEPTIKENNFLIFNRSVFKDHRMWVLAKLEEKKVLDNSLYSIIFPYKNEFKRCK